MEVSRSLGTPLHHQIFLVLRDSILSGRYSEGQPLPSESDLTGMFSVSRITVRRAIQTLTDAGLVERRQGRRTCVRGDATQKPLRAPLASLFESLESFDANTSVVVIAQERGAPSRLVQEMLKVTADQPVHRLVRVRQRQGKPVMQITTFLPSDIGKSFTAAALRKNPFFKMLDRVAPVSHAEQTVTATLADPMAAQNLGVAIGSPLLAVSRVYFSDGRPVSYLVFLAPPELFQVHMVLHK